jgi:aryl-alcohol dehydrogenase-like predicted oxidoreductase
MVPVLAREPEDDVVPAARRLGTAVVPYSPLVPHSPLGRGLLTGVLPAGEFPRATSGTATHASRATT